MSLRIASARAGSAVGCAASGIVIAAPHSRAANIVCRMNFFPFESSSSLPRARDELDHVEHRFEMRARKDQSPAPFADPFEHRGLVAIAIGAIAIGALLVAELDGAEKDHAA